MDINETINLNAPIGGVDKDGKEITLGVITATIEKSTLNISTNFSIYQKDLYELNRDAIKEQNAEFQIKVKQRVNDLGFGLYDLNV